MINAIIVEDELIQIAYLQNLLDDFFPEVRVVDTIHSESEVVQRLTERSFDLLFLDVKLGNSNAFELLEQLPQIDFHIIFISGFESYALQAIKSNAVDYLLKPFNVNELRVAVNKVTDRINNKESEISKSLNELPGAENCLCISERDSYTFIPCQTILYCKSEGNYTNIFVSNEKGDIETILSSKNLFHFEQKLCLNNFVRIHQSILVNKSKIRKIQKGSRELILSDGTILEIARDRKSEVLARLMR
ncbi:MAG: LytTR family DNA-binding domain-containing protein [Bacteroidetes bacterium]|nr:LytTR family DNA-binding domain-containing protein [Bacteroidota bacterium]